MSLIDKIEIPKRTMVIFFVIDTSGSMDGSRISALNTAIRELLSEIGEVSDENADVQIEIAVLGFSSGARWITADGPVEASQFNWPDLDAAGTTDFGAACRVLNEKLSTKAFMKEESESFAPIIFLTMDGEPTDEWKSALAELKQNNWFKVAIKIALPIGDEANRDVLKEFTGTMETVLETYNLNVLKKMIRFAPICNDSIAINFSEAILEEPSNAETNAEQKLEELHTVLRELNGVFKKFTGIMDEVLETYNPEVLKKLIKSVDAHDSQADGISSNFIESNNDDWELETTSNPDDGW